MHRANLLPGFSRQALALCRGYRSLRSSASGLLRCTPSSAAPTQPHEKSDAALIPLSPQLTSLAKCSDLSPAKTYTPIYSLPQIKLLSVISRLKLFQTALTAVILPPVYFLYLQGYVEYFLLGYSTAVALFAGVMLYAVSYFLRRVVGMMYVDGTRTTLKVSHLTFWGRRTDLYLPVSDVMTLGDTGDSVRETVLRLKRYSSPETLYFSTRIGRVTDKEAFEKVFGTLT